MRMVTRGRRMDVKSYIERIENQTRKTDIAKLVELLSEISHEEPKMWGSSIISFGFYKYKYDSGREGEAPKLGLSSRKQAIVIYGLHISDETHPNSKLVKGLGKYKTGKGCLYIQHLQDIDLMVLKQMVMNAQDQHDSC